MEILKAESLSLHGKQVAERASHLSAETDSIHRQGDKKNAVEEKEDALWLFAVEKTNQKNSAVVKQPEKNVSTVVMKAAEEIGAVTTSLEQDVTNCGEMEKERGGAIRELCKLCKGNDCVQ